MNPKLTLISITVKGRRISRFIMLPYNERGQVVVDNSIYQKIATDAGCQQGDTFTLS